MTLLLNPPFKPYPCQDAAIFLPCGGGCCRREIVPYFRAECEHADQEVRSLYLWGILFSVLLREAAMGYYVINRSRGKPVEQSVDKFGK